MFFGSETKRLPKRESQKKTRPLPLGQERSDLGWMLRLMLFFLAIVLFMLGMQTIFNAKYYIIQIKGDSMLHTLYGGVQVGGGEYEGGDFVYADRTAQPERGDIVIINIDDYREIFKIKAGETIIKRLIAVGGDRIKCEEGIVYLDSGEGYKPIEESYLSEGVYTSDFHERTLKAGEIFVMGDNRTNSTDSRSMGDRCLKEEDIVGVVPDWVLTVKPLITWWEGLRFGFYSAFQGN